MIQIITNNGYRHDFNNPYGMLITNKNVFFSYQEPNQDGKVCRTPISDIKYMLITEPIKIKFKMEKEQ